MYEPVEAHDAKGPDSSTRVQRSEWHAAGTQVTTFSGSVSLQAHCEVTAVMQERVGVDGQHYAIRFHMRLPEQWQGRLLFEGGGGTEGDLGASIGFIAPGTPTALERGYAVVSQDSGHDNTIDSVPERGGPAAFGFDPKARANYGGAFGALVDWVEHGIAPERILARAGPQSPWPGRSRPLCAYPKVARYNGSGSIEAAESFRCD